MIDVDDLQMPAEQFKCEIITEGVLFCNNLLLQQR